MLDKIVAEQLQMPRQRHAALMAQLSVELMPQWYSILYSPYYTLCRQTPDMTMYLLDKNAAAIQKPVPGLHLDCMWFNMMKA